MEDTPAVAPGGSARAHLLRVVGSEALALGFLVAAIMTKLAAMQHSSWREVFLANGDSLTLPLVFQSLQRGEPFHWIFSSQTFFFPEFPLYALCAVLTASVQSALVLNAVLNVILMYLGLRAIAWSVDPGRRVRQLLVSMAAVAIVLFVMLSEIDVKVVGVGTVEPARIATELLFTTYYAGVLFVALGMLALTFWVAHRFDGTSPSARRVVVYAVVVLTIGSATMFSNQLYLLWFVAPLGVVLLAMLIGRRITLLLALIVSAPQVVALGVGTVFRSMFSQFVAANYERYIYTYAAGDSAKMMGGVVADWVSSPLGVLRLITVLAPLVLVVVLLVRSATTRRPLASRDVFRAVFILVSTVSLIAGMIVTGQTVTRYLLPIFVFPPLAVLLVHLREASRVSVVLRQRVTSGLAGALVVVSVAAIAAAAPSVATFASNRPPVDTACLEGWLDAQPEGGAELNGAGDFWTVRALNAYDGDRSALVQMDAPTQAHAWMNNLALYEGRRFSFVIADSLNLTPTSVVESLGRPAAVVDCRGYSIYDYQGTAGETKLTRGLAASFAAISLTHRF